MEVVLEPRIKELKQEFIGRGSVHGRKFRLIERTHTAYLYAVNGGDYYEVFKKKICRNTAPWVLEYEYFVRYPSDEHFGLWAWTVNDYEMAIEKLNRL